jgi:choline-sulfatase/uncharacterized sulfatase
VTDRPNVLFIVSDQHNAKCLGHAGHADVRTPHLDRLAAEGVRFENAITQNPICTPSRVSFLSGQYCHNHGYYGLSGPNPGGLPNVIGHFRRNGYRTAALGKIHCPEYWIEDTSDVFHETSGCSVGGRSPEYAAYLEERGLTDLEDHGRLHEFGPRGRQSVEGRPSKVSFEDGQEGWIARTAIDTMRAARDDGRPFFIHASLPKPHQCYTPAQEFWNLYDQSKLTLPPNADYTMTGKAPHLRRAAESWRRRHWQLFEPKTFEAGRLRKLHGYLGNISHVDHTVGQMVDWLDGHGPADDTIVVYTSDHGDYACEHGIMEKAPGICSDAITRVPCLWRWPGRFAAGHTASELVELIDVPTTLCSLAGLPPMPTSDGKDMSHLLRGGRGDVRSIAVTEFPFSRSVRKGWYRLVWYARFLFADEHPDGFGELYDLEADPWEMRNRFFDPDYAPVMRELRGELLEWLVETSRFTTCHPPFEKRGEGYATRNHTTVLADGRIGREQVWPPSRGMNYF